MTTELRSFDGRYTAYDQGDGNFVVYDHGVAVWDRWSYEAITGSTQPEPPPPPSSSGGFIEHVSSTAARPMLTDLNFIPRRGRFTFPAPYNTEAIRVTNEDDGDLEPAGYAYWPMINNHRGSVNMLVFVGHKTGKPRFFSVDKNSGVVTPLGSLLSYLGTGEGWRWSAQPGAQLYLHDGPYLRRVDIQNGTDDVVCDISVSHPGCRIWQHHSSDDGLTHSATIQRIVSDGKYPDVAIGIWQNGRPRTFTIPDGYDECQLDKSGRWLIIKEGVEPNGVTGINNRIIDLITGEERIILNAEGAVGHSDTVMSAVVGEDDQHEPCAMVRWRLDRPLERELLYYATDWDGGMGHVSARGSTYLISNVSHQNSRRNELLVVSPDGNGQIRVIAPNLMRLPPGDIAYENQVQANLDPIAEWCAWTANPLGRLDLFLVRL